MRRAMLLAAVGALLLAAVASTALARDKAPTRVTIDTAMRTPTEDQWAGDIFSGRKVCKDGRRVLVMLQRPGDDRKIGSTLSFEGTGQPGYFWIYSQTDRAPSGRYYAKVRATDRCQGDRSEAIQSEW